jgi:hypothetical protein
MNLHFTLIIGSPGAGKSTLGNKMLQEDNEKAIFLDDLSVLIKNNPIEYIEEQIKIHQCNHVIISDVNFCFESIRSQAIELLSSHFKCPISYIFFENNLEKCLLNIQKRMSEGDTRNVIQLATYIAKQYVVPDGFNPHIIYSSIKHKI